MSLVHRADQVGPDIVALGCHRCGARYGGDQLNEILSFDELQCLESDCHAGGMIPYRSSTIDERYPAPLSERFTPLPEALMDHRSALNIGPNELLVIWALERHRRAMGDVVFPGQARLAALAGLSVHQVRRALTKLVGAGLVGRDQPGAGGKRGRARVHYHLDPLWERLAELEGGNGSPVRAPRSIVIDLDDDIPFGELVDTSAHQTGFGEQERTPKEVADGFGAHSEGGLVRTTSPIWCAPDAPEVDVEEVDANREDPVGTSPAPQPEPLHAVAEPAPDVVAEDDSATDEEKEHFRRALELQAAHPERKLTISKAYELTETATTEETTTETTPKLRVAA